MIQLLKSSTSPFGRCNRSGLLQMTCALIAVQASVSALIWLTGDTLHGTVSLLFKSLFIWIGFCATAKRLHDIGLSAWWIPGFIIALTVWSFIQTFALFFIIGPAVLNIHGPMFWLMCAGIITPVLAVTVWLHYAPGHPQSNKYGPYPGIKGISSPTSANPATGYLPKGT